MSALAGLAIFRSVFERWAATYLLQKLHLCGDTPPA